MKYGKELAQEIQNEMENLEEAIENRYIRIASGKTDMDDCFMSQNTEEKGISKCKMMIEVLNGDGLMDLHCFRDNDNKVHQYRWVDTRYGMKIVSDGIFASSVKAMKFKTGWKEDYIRVPCWVKFEAGSGGGMCGAYTGQYNYVRWHTNMVTGEYVGFEWFKEG